MENEQTYSERSTEFGEAWAGHEGGDIAKLIVAAGERIAALCLDDPAVDTAMKALHEGLGLEGFDGFHEGPRDWRTLWAEYSGSGVDVMPLSDKVTSLHAYAYFGLSPNHSRGPCSIADIKAAIGIVKKALGQTATVPDTSELDRTILAAEGRLALDEGRDVPLDQLAALTRLSIRSMRNVAAPSSGSGLDMRNGAASAESALNWLRTRDDFKSSIWRLADEIDEAEQREFSSSQRAEGEIVWVPFASDGSEFDPVSCQRGGGYTIGPKGAEVKIEDYRRALNELSRMRPAAYWRRPNTAGNWGIVVAEGFRPRTASELGLRATGGDK